MLCAKTMILSTTPDFISEMNFVKGDDKTVAEIQKTRNLSERSSTQNENAANLAFL